MTPAKDAFLFRELQVIQKIIHDETWLEGERRGCYVSPNDPVVRERVCGVILRIGQSLRDSVARAMAPAFGSQESRPSPPHPESSPASHDAAA
jgi:hypothetical protein